MKQTTSRIVLAVFSLSLASTAASPPPAELEAAIEAVMEKVVAWRRDIHQHPELSNREFRTAALVAEHLRSLDLDSVETGIAHTGVVGTLIGGEMRPAAVFGLHVFPFAPGSIGYRAEGMLAAADWLHILVRGRQTHGSAPWRGVDPVTAAGQIVAALQTIPSRQMDLTQAPVVVSVGAIHGGVRGNIIPDTVELTGTIRTFDPAMQDDFHRRIRRTAESVAEAAGATAEVTIRRYAPVTYNDPELTRQMAPTLDWAARGKTFEARPITGAEDFSFFAKEAPGLFIFLGVNREGVGPDEAAPNHSPHFYANEDALVVGVRAMAGLAWDFLNGN